MSTYWQQKLRVAPGSEPETCRRLIDLLTPYIYGKNYSRYIYIYIYILILFHQIIIL